MSKRRRTLVMLFLLACIGATGALASFMLTPAPIEHRICQASCDRITRESTESQVEAIFLVPPGDYTTRPDVPMVYNYWQRQSHLKWRTWYSDRAAVAIGFDQSGRVAGFAAAYNDEPDCGVSYKVRRLFGQIPSTRRATPMQEQR